MAAIRGSAKRHSFIARFEERVRVDDNRFDLSPVDSPDHHPDPVPGAELRRFSDRPWPTAEFGVGQGSVLRELRMPRREGADPASVCVRYIARDRPAELTLRPMLTCREADALTFANEALSTSVEEMADGIRVRPYSSLPTVTVRWRTTAGASVAAGNRDGAGSQGGAGEPSWASNPCWRRGIRFQMDLIRGYDGHEDQWSPGQISTTLAPGEALEVQCVVDETEGEPARWLTWPSDPASAADAPSDPASRALDFLYRAPVGTPSATASSGATSWRTGVLAGFPWFGEWGRDVFIALPGLTLARGDVEGCAEVLDGALPFLRNGLLPNIYGVAPEDSHYGSVDASLWFARAVRLWRQHAPERAGDRYLDALTEIATHYYDGSAGLGIGVHGGGGAGDGLLYCGAPELNPTWMDAQTPHGPVTPRYGSPVEICALWCGLLDDLADALERADRTADARLWRERSDRAVAAFVDAFWLADGYLADVVRRPDHGADGAMHVDRSVRPNMVLAAALDNAPLTVDQRRKVVALARRELLTPVGLRTLSPADPAYRPRYEGGTVGRDEAYHQGTVWPWLLGFFTEAALRSGAAPAELRHLWSGVEAETRRAGLGHISEVFDGEAPHRPGGSFAQAWNTAEWLRALAMIEHGLPESAAARDRTGGGNPAKSSASSGSPRAASDSRPKPPKRPSSDRKPKNTDSRSIGSGNTGSKTIDSKSLAPTAKSSAAGSAKTADGSQRASEQKASKDHPDASGEARKAPVRPQEKTQSSGGTDHPGSDCGTDSPVRDTASVESVDHDAGLATDRSAGATKPPAAPSGRKPGKGRTRRMKRRKHGGA